MGRDAQIGGETLRFLARGHGYAKSQNNGLSRIKTVTGKFMTNPKRLRKMALYLEYIAHLLRDDAKDMEAINVCRKRSKGKKKVGRPVATKPDAP